MKKLIVGGLAIALLGGAAVSQMQDPQEDIIYITGPVEAQPEKGHQWLTQLEGEWESEGEIFTEPGQPSIKTTGTENVRSIGGFWIVAENSGSVMDMSFTGILTLGYDPQKQQYIGTWIDSMSNHLWTYEGKLDSAGRVLTLETTGPCPMTGEPCNFREVLELKSANHKVFTSSIQGEDGTWTKMVTVNYRRAG